jgi:cytochrome bd ubiquinol oxidase subunit I
VFFSFRVMVGLGFAMLGLGLWGAVMRWRGKLHSSAMLHRAAIVMGPMGFVAVLAGWITTEVGRQPFTIYGLLRTSDSLAPVSAPAVAASLTAFIIVYFFVFGAGVYYILRLMGKRPKVGAVGEITDGPIRTAGTTQVAHKGHKNQRPAE